MTAKTTKQIDTPRVDKASLLNGLYTYLGGRIDSVGRRASLMMALLGSFLGIASAAITRGEAVPLMTKVIFLMQHPSIVVGLIAMAVLLFSETAKIKSSKDLMSRIAFSDEAISHVHQAYVDSSINELFGEVISNARIVGGFLRKKVVLYNIGSTLFVISVVLYVFGL